MRVIQRLLPKRTSMISKWEKRFYQMAELVAVSYTHLTLPTMELV